MAKKILVIDDSASLRLVIVQSLKTMGVEVEQAGDGKEGLEKVKSMNPDLVVCDVNMPVMDGLTFVKKLKCIEEYKFIPVVMLTTESDDKRIEEGRAAGVKIWLTKPFETITLLDAVEKILL